MIYCQTTLFGLKPQAANVVMAQSIAEHEQCKVQSGTSINQISL